LDILSTLLIAAGLAMDAFAVSLASAMTIRTPKASHALRFGLFFGFFQFLMPVLGWLLGSYFAGLITAYDHWVAFSLLAVIGARMIWESVKGDDETETDEGRLLSFKNMLLLAIATSIDALAVGVSFAVVNTSIWFSSAVIGVVAFLFSFIGVLLGKRLGVLVGKRMEILGGVILIAIGVKILIEHLFFQ